MSGMYDKAVALFEESGYQWHIDGELQIPTKEDIRAAVARMVDNLADCEDGSTFTMGHLLVQKLNGHYDVYLRLGDTQEIIIGG